VSARLQSSAGELIRLAWERGLLSQLPGLSRIVGTNSILRNGFKGGITDGLLIWRALCGGGVRPTILPFDVMMEGKVAMHAGDVQEFKELDIAGGLLNKLDPILFPSGDGAQACRSLAEMILGNLQASSDETCIDSQLPIVLNGQGKSVTVNGIQKPALTSAQYDVVQTLLQAGSKGLSKDELPNKSKHGDAVRILGRIAAIDADWKAVVGLAGKPGGRYRILGLD